MCVYSVCVQHGSSSASFPSQPACCRRDSHRSGRPCAGAVAARRGAGESPAASLLAGCGESSRALQRPRLPAAVGRALSPWRAPVHPVRGDDKESRTDRGFLLGGRLLQADGRDNKA